MFVHFFTNDKVYFLRKFNLVRTEIWNNGLFQKIGGGGGGGWGYRISSSTEEIAKGIFRGKLKTTWNFQGWSWKNHVEFSEVMVLDLKISDKCNTINFVDFLAWSFVDKFINMRQCGDIEKIEKNNLLLQNDQFFSEGFEIFRKRLF